MRGFFDLDEAIGAGARGSAVAARAAPTGVSASGDAACHGAQRCGTQAPV